MSNDLHHSTLILELLQLVLLNNFLLNLFYCYHCVFPSSTIDNTITTFRDLLIQVYIVEVDFVVGLEDPTLSQSHYLLLLLHEELPDLLFDVLFVGTSLV